jgi:hypothetical protein
MTYASFGRPTRNESSSRSAVPAVLGVDRVAGQPGPMGAQRRERVGVGRRLREHRLTGCHEQAQDQVEGVLGAIS